MLEGVEDQTVADFRLLSEFTAPWGMLPSRSSDRLHRFFRPVSTRAFRRLLMRLSIVGSRVCEPLRLDNQVPTLFQIPRFFFARFFYKALAA